MGITIDKTIHYGYYTDDEGTIYPFSVEMEDDVTEISWDDDQPENVDDIEDELREMF